MMTSCTLRNYRPQRCKLSSAEYIRKGEFRSLHKFQNDGLPSGIYGFITNRDGDISYDERMRIGREEMTEHVMSRAFLLDDQPTTIVDDEYPSKKLNRYDLFRMLSIGMVYQAKVKIGCEDEYSLNIEESSYHIGSLEKYKAELGIESDRSVEEAIDLFVKTYHTVGEDGLLIYPIRYLLEKYDGICNYANNTASGGSVYFKDINPRVGTKSGYSSFAFQENQKTVTILTIRFANGDPITLGIDRGDTVLSLKRFIQRHNLGDVGRGRLVYMKDMKSPHIILEDDVRLDLDLVPNRNSNRKERISDGIIVIR
jgi:hypothetical protein